MAKQPIEMCPHRWEVRFSIGAIGVAETKEEAIKEAKTYGLDDFSYIQDNLTFESAELANDMDTCDICEEEDS